MYADDTIKMLLSINAVLTLFWGEDGASVREPEAQLSCLVPVDETTRSRETKQPNGTTKAKAANMAVLGAAMALVWALL